MIHPAELEYFVYVPNGTTQSGTLYELEPTGRFGPNTFILLPYANPQVKKTEARYYSVKRSFNVNDLAELNHKPTPQPLYLKAVTSKNRYMEQVHTLKQHIQLGNIYEINYCIRLQAHEAMIDPIITFAELHRLARAPYAALVKLKDEFIICASPELFLQKKGDMLFTKPIKGTIRRGKNGEEDDAFKQALYESIKERTENVMAVDVARNDLSRLAKKATVQVNRLYNIETFETVHQMVSTISCELKENTSFETIVDCTFPMASMTGAPKLRAMQLTDEHEDFERNYYSGAMGLADANGDFTLSVIIRSIFYNQRSRELSIAVGSAITYLSEPEQEYEECLLKAGALLKALNAELA